MPSPPALSPLAEFARQHDPDRFLCALFAPAVKREALYLLIAYNHELARAREAARTPLIALMRLQWWREVIEQAVVGDPPRRHEVAEPLHAAIRDGTLEAETLLAMADAREGEAEEEGIPSREAFHAYLQGSAGGLAIAAGRLLGAPPGLLPALQAAGGAYGLAGVLRSVPALAAQGRCLLPLDALAAAGLGPEAVIRDPAAARPVVAALAAEGRERLAAARPGLRRLDRAAVAAALPAVLARRDLRRLARDGGGETGPRGLGDRLAVILAGLAARA
ncbi:squalene/phytoene synthase family protein [Roseicella sp. DB1501]|uniref:squalene/phytoene synthase family protein n=1 Tax=Roseicella sp. DB1501 TaxID=2730925 RepID=UPI001491D625|nr:squalene/phytoene synthase family protein [Roseicella sp. DB1501]NOG73253.1 squalene/phytoene synthase family protein [Roseicella sp. DB1501]